MCDSCVVTTSPLDLEDCVSAMYGVDFSAYEDVNKHLVCIICHVWGILKGCVTEND